MFKQIKSAIFWTLVYKFRKRLTIVVILLSTVLLSQWIYSDIVEYLKLSEKIIYLNYVLMAKWIIIFTNIGISAYLILTLFKTEDKDLSKNKTTKKKNLEDSNTETTLDTFSKNKSSNSFSEKEKRFLKKRLRTEAELLMDR